MKRPCTDNWHFPAWWRILVVTSCLADQFQEVQAVPKFWCHSSWPNSWVCRNLATGKEQKEPKHQGVYLRINKTCKCMPAIWKLRTGNLGTRIMRSFDVCMSVTSWRICAPDMFKVLSFQKGKREAQSSKRAQKICFRPNEVKVNPEQVCLCPNIAAQWDKNQVVIELCWLFCVDNWGFKDWKCFISITSSATTGCFFYVSSESGNPSCEGQTHSRTRWVLILFPSDSFELFYCSFILLQIFLHCAWG